jgi:hypothetical protein
VAPLVASVSFAVEAECHCCGWKKAIVVVIARVAVSDVTIDNVSVISQSAKWLKGVANTDNRKH